MSSTSSRATNAPISARRSEMPRPMPDAAPVTIATLPVSASKFAARSSIFVDCIFIETRGLSQWLAITDFTHWDFLGPDVPLGVFPKAGKSRKSAPGAWQRSSASVPAQERSKLALMLWPVPFRVPRRSCSSRSRARGSRCRTAETAGPRRTPGSARRLSRHRWRAGSRIRY